MNVQVPSAQLKTDAQGQAYLKRLLERTQVTSDGGWLQEVRDRATAMVQELGIPSSKDEQWRFTDLKPLRETEFSPAQVSQISPTASLEQLGLNVPEAKESRLVFVNGRYAPELSSTAAVPAGVWIGHLAEFPDSERLQPYLAQQPGDREVFTALNTTSFPDAAVVWIPKNTEVEPPLHLLFIATGEQQPTISHPRCLVVAERSSACTLIEEYIVAEREWCQQPVADQPYFTNTVAEFWLQENAQMKHARIQREGTDAFHIGKNAITQAKDSRYSCVAISVGARLARHHLEVFQAGTGTETTLNGLSMVCGDQLSDLHSLISTNHPNGKANQIHKCIIDDRAHSVFNGKILVPQTAQQTDASQLNRNLLLSRQGKVNTKPQLEIVADDVKCAHGATVSQLESEELFYLQSRGLDLETSRNLLLDSFCREILQKLPVPSLTTKLSRCFACRTSSENQ
ncbi:Fe-S cluster assembly protein SufD [Geitlerinema sp. PCC 9228]|jgi:Fe-S cluster assembly protein SufD|uniref:Fe-S cluster assembly protein SufD n=1 Tax=Geitlerinema sp. PCC 9228 TaxID=111611 RepID=UPI0008F9A82B|nr:Fe-S cluster assembly protein SufD [Geitlerinema sp. PCC 9228]